MYEPWGHSRQRVMGTTATQQAEGYGNHSDTAGRGLWEPHGHSRQRVMGTTATQQAEDYGNQQGHSRQSYGNHRSIAGNGSDRHAMISTPIGNLQHSGGSLIRLQAVNKEGEDPRTEAQFVARRFLLHRINRTFKCK